MTDKVSTPRETPSAEAARRPWFRRVFDPPIAARIARITGGVGILFLSAAAMLLLQEIVADNQFSAPIRLSQSAMLAAAFLFLISTFLHAVPSKDAGAWRGVGYQVAAFLILGLSLRAFAIREEIRENREAARAEATSTAASAQTGKTVGGSRQTKIPTVRTDESQRQPASQTHASHSVITVAELASIMILFVLAEFGAFIGRDVGRLQDDTERTLIHADSLQKAFEKAESSIHEAADTLKKYDIPAVVAEIEGDARDALRDLLQAWAERFEKVRKAKHDGAPFLGTAWRVLMREYFREEKSDFVPPNLNQTRGIPAAARPFRSMVDNDGIEQSVETAEVSYFASNIGFYARLLAALVSDLHRHLNTNGAVEKRMRILGVTSVLPAHWWNWPMSDGIWAAYEPITELRKATDRIPDNVQTDRFLLVAPPAESIVRGLLNKKDLVEMLGWILLDRDDSARYLSYGELHQEANKEIVAKLIPKLQESFGLVAARDRQIKLFPILTERIDDKLLSSVSTWRQQSLRDAYLSLHKGGGHCWVIEATEALRDQLEGRYDFTFFGITDQPSASERKNQDSFSEVWNADINWQFCLMTSASPSSETMFLTVVSGEGAKLHFNTCKAAFETFKNSQRLRDISVPSAPAP